MGNATHLSATFRNVVSEQDEIFENIYDSAAHTVTLENVLKS